MRRMRHSENIRKLCCESNLSATDLIWPIFVIEGQSKSVPIESMPGVSRVSIDMLPAMAEQAERLGIPALALFPVIAQEAKTLEAQEAWRQKNLISRALLQLQEFSITSICDVALDPYTIHGHDGVIRGNQVDNSATLQALSKQAIALAEAGADILAPSDMMDGRIKHLRQCLDAQQHTEVALVSYAAKFASNFYSPFRDALNAPRSKKERSEKSNIPRDKRTYQIDYANAEEALWEIALDIQEGADMVIVKPAIPYLDIVRRAKEAFAVPILCYHVSGEYTAIASAAKAGYLDQKECLLEQLIGCKRAGASAVITYYAPRAAKWINETKTG